MRRFTICVLIALAVALGASVAIADQHVTATASMYSPTDEYQFSWNLTWLWFDGFGSGVFTGGFEGPDNLSVTATVSTTMAGIFPDEDTDSLYVPTGQTQPSWTGQAFVYGMGAIPPVEASYTCTCAIIARSWGTYGEDDKTNDFTIVKPPWMRVAPIVTPPALPGSD
jgi:hypothetical protein